MRSIILFEDGYCQDLLPLTYWRTVGELRVGYGRLFDHAMHTLWHWSQGSELSISLYCRPEMAAVTAERFQLPCNPAPRKPRRGEGAANSVRGDGGKISECTLLINSRLVLLSGPQLELAPAVQWAGEDPILIHADAKLLARLTPEVMLNPRALKEVLDPVPRKTFIDAPRLVRHPWDLVELNHDLLMLGWRRTGEPAESLGRISDGVHRINRSAIHVGRGSAIKPGAVLDAEEGPIFVGQNVRVMPGAILIGPCYIGDGSLIQPGAVIREDCSIGQRCKVGGEVAETIIQGFSNKQHYGFLGHSYLGSWVNLGAGTTNSDLKNTYGPVRVPINGKEVETGQMFVGMFVGDHSKSGIGQMFPTGSVVGFGSQVSSGKLSPKFVPSFTWLTERGAEPYDVKRCLEVAQRVMARRERAMTSAERELFLSLPERSGQFEAREDG